MGWARMIGLLVATAMVITACGGDDGSGSEDLGSTSATATSTETTQTAAPGTTTPPRRKAARAAPVWLW
jgi:hypothetical protein